MISFFPTSNRPILCVNYKITTCSIKVLTISTLTFSNVGYQHCIEHSVEQMETTLVQKPIYTLNTSDSCFSLPQPRFNIGHPFCSRPWTIPLTRRRTLWPSRLKSKLLALMLHYNWILSLCVVSRGCISGLQLRYRKWTKFNRDSSQYSSRSERHVANVGDVVQFIGFLNRGNDGQSVNQNASQTHTTSLCVPPSTATGNDHR